MTPCSDFKASKRDLEETKTKKHEHKRPLQTNALPTLSHPLSPASPAPDSEGTHLTRQ